MRERYRPIIEGQTIARPQIRYENVLTPEISRFSIITDVEKIGALAWQTLKMENDRIVDMTVILDGDPSFDLHEAKNGENIKPRFGQSSSFSVEEKSVTLHIEKSINVAKTIIGNLNGRQYKHLFGSDGMDPEKAWAQLTRQELGVSLATGVASLTRPSISLKKYAESSHRHFSWMYLVSGVTASTSGPAVGLNVLLWSALFQTAWYRYLKFQKDIKMNDDIHPEFTRTPEEHGRKRATDLQRVGALHAWAEAFTVTPLQ